ncbi:sialate O-acetylesterase [Acinetobacter baumannii]|uniref:sialate O-acetylesterase n=1 Tax=Acinetobacter baumannii TaxID=470 RepID=UPI003F62FB5B
MPLPNADQFVGQNVTESGFKQAQTQLIEYLGDEVPTNEKLVNSFATKAIADSKTSLMPIDYKVTVTSDPDEANNGDYTWNGTELVKSPYDPVVISNGYTNRQVESIGNALDIKMANDPKIDCIHADALGRALIYYDKENECFVGAGLFESLFKIIGQLKKYEDSRYSTDPVDANGRLLFGWDKLTDSFFCGENFGVQQQTKNYHFFEQAQQIGTVNHMLWYGESYTMGAAAPDVLSTSQPYKNLTFDSGPRKDVEATSVIPLREFFTDPSVDGYHDRGETCCSGSANYASVSMMKNRGVRPNDHVIFSSTAGHGSFKLSDLIKGTSWYPRLLAHVSKAKQLINDPGYTPQIINFVQGANDAAVASRTPKSVYKPMLVQLQIDAETDIKTASGKDNPIRFMLAQMSYGTAAHKDMALAHLELCQESDKFMLVTPMYHFPYDGDKIHLTNIGYKWMSAYFGRAYDQYIYENRKPDFINPRLAYIENDTVIIKFDVPALPLQIDTTSLAPTTDSGFKVLLLDENGAIQLDANSQQVVADITEVLIKDDTVLLKLAAPVAEGALVRYGLDYQGTGLTLTEGASGNLRDSTKETALIEGEEKPLYHVCPHFELTAYLDKGI